MSASRPAASLDWAPKLARLARMSPREMLFRGGQAAWTLGERMLIGWGMNPAGSPGLAAAPESSRFYFDPTAREAIVADLARRQPDWIARADRKAAAVCDDPWYRSPRWNADIAGRAEWPRRFYADLDLFSGDAGHGDVRVLWEVNRHRTLVDLAKGWFLTGNREYARRCRALLLGSWRPENPYGIGINWTSALEVAMRVLAWSWIYHFLDGVEEMDETDRLGLLTGLHEHGVYLERHLSVYFSPNNHLVGEATALYLLGTFAAALPRAARWERMGWEILVREATRQFHEDGASSEQATCYHGYTLGFYYQAVALRLIRGQDLEPVVHESLERATRFVLHLSRPDGRVPMIGDNDDAVAFPVGEGPGWDLRHILAAGAVLFEQPEFRWGAGCFSEFAYWLLGAAGRARFESLAPAPPRAPSVALPQSGYCVMRSGWERDSHYLCMDCGPLAAGVPRDGTSASAHGHADALALEIVAHGQPMVVDPGCPSYNAEPDWLRYFRGSSAHNTWAVDGRSQSEPAGRLRWKCPANARLEAWTSGERLDYARGSHDGYERSPVGVRHRRAVVFLRSWGWVVWDRFEGSGAHRLETCLPFDPAVSVQAWNGGLLARGGDVQLALWLLAEQPLAPRLVRGGSGPDQGWVVPTYLRREPAWTARFDLSAELPATLWQVHRPARGRPPALRLQRFAGEGVEALRIVEEERTHLLLHAVSPGVPSRLGPVVTDAQLLWISRDEGAEEWQGEVVEGSFVRRDSGYLWRARGSRESGRFVMAGLLPELQGNPE